MAICFHGQTDYIKIRPCTLKLKEKIEKRCRGKKEKINRCFVF